MCQSQQRRHDPYWWELFRDKHTKQILELSDTARFATIVADGMGGHSGGEFASEIALKCFDEFVLKLPDGIDEIEITSNLKQWAENTHRYILNKSNEMPNCEGMGSTFADCSFWGNGSSIEYRRQQDISLSKWDTQTIDYRSFNKSTNWRSFTRFQPDLQLTGWWRFNI